MNTLTDEFIPDTDDDFVPDAQRAPTSQGGYWADVGRNAMTEGKRIIGNARGEALRMFPLVESVSKPLSGGIPSLQDIKNTGQFLKVGGQAAFQAAKDVGSAAFAPIQSFTGTPMAETDIGQKFRERPISTAMNVASVAPVAGFLRGRVRPSVSEMPAELPILEPGAKTGNPHALFAYNDNFGPGGASRAMYNVFGDPSHPGIKKSGWGSSLPREEVDASGIPITGREPRARGMEPAGSGQAAAGAKPLNFLQRLGTKGVNSQAGISPETVQSLTRSGINPAEVGASIGKRLVDENIIGQSSSETFANATAKQKEYGQSVQSALDEIKKANRSLGEYPELEDSLKVESNRALKPLLDKKVTLANSPFSANKRMSRPWTEAYTYLADQANASGGFTTLDHVNGALQQVGQMLGKLEKGSAPYKNVASLYGTLANVRDGMVRDIAQLVGDPQLAQNLLKANDGYSFYSRIMPDLNWQAAAESVGGPETTIMGTLKTEAKPFLSKTAVKAGSWWQQQL